MQSVSNVDIRPLEGGEIDAVSGGWIFAVIAAELFTIGFMVGVAAYNYTHGRPLTEF